MPSPDPVALLVGRLERAVVAAGRHRRELAREVEGDLREDVAARVRAGVPERDAAEAVVAEFGDPRELAVELSLELLADRGKRFAWFAALGAAVLIALQLTMTHWFYLYLVWFLPLLLIALLTPAAAGSARSPSPDPDPSSAPAPR